MKITAYLINGAKLEWDEPAEFQLVPAVKFWRADGYIQSPTFYISMNAVAFITSGQSTITFDLPAKPTLQ